jgi:CarD family transcriptional regulator
VVVKTKPVRKLSIGSRVFYPGHGVATVTAMEEREFGAGKQIFYVLELKLDRGVKLMLPEGKVESAAIRDLISATRARELMKAVMEEPEPKEIKSDPASRKQRATGYGEALRSGDPDRYTEILNELLFRSRASKLSASEQSTLNTALSYFVGEVAAALDSSPDEVKADLRAVTSVALP